MSVGEPGYLQQLLSSNGQFGASSWTTTATSNDYWSYYQLPNTTITVGAPWLRDPHGINIDEGPQLPEGVDMLGLYEVTMVYAEDRKNPVVVTKDKILAASDEDAKVKSGLMAQVSVEWDADYLTFICKKIGDIKVKQKPQEVKNV